MKSSSTHYVFNEALEVTPANDSTSVPMVLCELPATTGESVRFVAPAELVELLRLFDGSLSVAEVAAISARQKSTTYTAEKLERLIAGFCLPKGILLDPSRTRSQVVAEPSRRSYLSIRLRVFPNRVLRPVVCVLAPLFGRATALVICAAVIIAHLKFYFASNVRFPDLVLAGGPDLATAMLLSIVAALGHELGHATAFTRYGGRGTEIGLGLYLYMPVLYTDVSDAWRFNRLQRVIVDLGGIYFQAAFGAAAIVLFFLTHAAVWAHTVFLVTLSLSFSLNPFLRMDGYWFLADAFGIRNLRFHSLQLLKYCVWYLLGKRPALPASLSNWTRRTKCVLGAYTLFSTAFFAVLITRMACQALFVLLPQYPNLVMTIIRRIVGQPADIVAVSSGVVEICWKTMILVGCALFGWRLVQSIHLYLRRNLPARCVASARFFAPAEEQKARRPRSDIRKIGTEKGGGSLGMI
jgi:putative peptide zinc metalloprotease protein